MAFGSAFTIRYERSRNPAFSNAILSSLALRLWTNTTLVSPLLQPFVLFREEFVVLFKFALRVRVRGRGRERERVAPFSLGMDASLPLGLIMTWNEL